MGFPSSVETISPRRFLDTGAITPFGKDSASRAAETCPFGL